MTRLSALSALVLAAALVHAADPLPPPDLSAGFDGSAEARDSSGTVVAPLAATGLVFVDGLRGKAVRISGAGGAKPELRFAAGGLLRPEAGTVTMWVRPLWDGTDREKAELPWRYLFGTRGGDLALWFYEWYLRGEVVDKDGKRAQLGMACRNGWRAGDWHHVALIWNRSAWSQVIVDGLPYNSGLGGCPAPAMARDHAAPAGITDLAIGMTGKGDRFAEADFDDLQVWNRALAPEQIAGLYRGAVAIDATCERRWLAAGAPERVAVELFPGGALPYLDAAGVVAGPVAIDAELAIDGPDGAPIASVKRNLALAGRSVLTLDTPALAVGAHRARLSWKTIHGTPVQRSWALTAYVPQPANPDTGPVAAGAPTLDIDCATQAPVAGNDTTVRTLAGGAVVRETAGTSRDERFAYEVAIPEGQYDGQPWEIAFTWPDDKPRTLGLYLYKGTEGSKVDHHRDRIEGGVFGGAEFPESGGLVTTRYVFFPWGPKYLAEVRTLVAGQGAALARLSVRPLGARLPRLAITPPPGGGRGFGHFDEDQTWEVPLAFDAPAGPFKTLRMADLLMDYLDHAGLDVLNYCSLRYASAMYDLPGMRCGGGHFFEAAGYQGLLLDRAAARGKRVVVSLNLNGIPEVAGRPDLAGHYRSIGYQRLDRAGQPAKAWDGTPLGTPLHPEHRRRLLGHIDELIARFAAHPGCAGFDLWGGDWALRPLANGFDATTAGAFARAAGIAGLPTGDDPAACAARADLLLGAKRDAWIRWCAAVNTATVAEIARHLAAVNPQATLRVHLGGDALDGSVDAPSADGLDPLQDNLKDGLDPAALRALPNVVPMPVRQPTFDRWHQHWNRQRSTGDESLADLARQGGLATPGRTVSASYLRYFESYQKSLLNDIYRSYFQDSDAKAHGRFFLKELVHSLVAYDAQELLIGAQSLGTSGREDEAREFARAFRALPRVGFSDLPGSRDPAWVRACRDGNDAWWVYAVNAWHAPVAVELALPVAAAVRDLGAGLALTPADGRLRLNLLPFQLVALRLEHAAASPTVAAIVPEAAGVVAAQARATAYEAAIADLAKADAPVTAHRDRLARIRTALASGAVAEAHRLWASKPVFALPDELEAARKGFLGERARMIAKGHYAVNCGASRYVRTDKALFFPDQPWLGGSAGFGFDGPHQAAEHAIDKLVGPVNRYLVFSEAYDVLAYRFKVPAGNYLVRVYNRIGFGPNAATGRMVMTLTVEGKRVWDRLDLFEALGKDDRNVLVSEFPGISCSDGVLDLEWRQPDGSGGWVNAIEVIPEAAKGTP